MIYQCAVTPILEDIVAEGERVLGIAAGDGVAVRLLGGVAVRLRAETLPAAFDREYKDLDFAAPKGDVFVGAFRMCHEIPFGDRLAVQDRTVPLAELLLTKLQIVELNEKDVRDTLLLVYGHEVADRDGDAINGARVAELCASDWGLWRTITANVETVLGHTDRYEVADEDRARMAARLRALLDRIEAEPKTRGWRLRAKIGERKRWYELPEEVE